MAGLIATLNVDWASYYLTTYADSTKVIEFAMPEDSALAVPGGLAPQARAGYRSKTSAVFILRNDSLKLSFFMKTVEDGSAAGYQPVLGQVHYKQVPGTFTGNVYYFSLGRQYLNGYQWRQGTITNALAITAAQGQVRSLRRGPVSFEASSCEVTYDVYWYTISGGEITHEEFLGSITIDTCGGGDGGGGGGSGGGTGAGGGSGGGGAAGDNTTPNPQPCAPAPPPAGVESIHGRVRVFVVQPTGPPTGGGGTGGGSSNPPCATVGTPDPCGQGKVLAHIAPFIAIMNDLNSKLSQPSEYAYRKNYNNGNTSYDLLEGGQSGVNFNFNLSFFDNTIGFTHSHEVNDQNLSIFSPADLQTFYQAVANGKVHNQATYTFGLVTPTGSYLLAINDLAKFLQAGAQNLNASQANAINSTYNYFCKITNTPTQNEDGFVNFINTLGGGLGLTLMKDAGNFSNRKVVGKDGSGNLVYVQC